MNNQVGSVGRVRSPRLPHGGSGDSELGRWERFLDGQIQFSVFLCFMKKN